MSYKAFSLNTSAVALGKTGSANATISTVSCTSSQAQPLMPPLSYRSAIGVIFFICTATDSNNVVSTCRFSSFVLDLELPQITCAADFNSTTIINTNYTIVDTNLIQASATDNSGSVSTVCVINSTTMYANATGFPTYQVVSCTATDLSNNTASCTMRVFVWDAQPPTIVGCPSPINVTEVTGTGFAAASWTMPTAVDNVNGAVPVTCSYTSGALFPIGATTVACTAQDAVGNIGVCAFSVFVKDNTPPTVVCPASFTVMSLLGWSYVNWSLPTATDGTGIASTQIDFFSTPMCSTGTLCTVTSLNLTVSPGVFTFTAYNTWGLSSQCHWSITIVLPPDVTPPVWTSGCTNVTSPSFGPFPTTAGANTAVVTWASLTAVDDRTSVSYATLSTPLGLSQGSSFPVGTSYIYVTATDVAGNVLYCNFTVVVIDTEPPTIGSCSHNNSVILTVPNDYRSNTTLVTASQVCVLSNCFQTLSATDNVAMNTTWYTVINDYGTSIFTFPLRFPVGRNVVRYSARDKAGNVAICDQTVLIQDREAPRFLECNNFAAHTDPGSNTTFVPCPYVTFTDNVAVVEEVVSPFTPGVDCNITLSIGTKRVVYTIFDAANNSAVCNISLGVVDLEPPVFTQCPPSQTTTTDPGRNTAVVPTIAFAATDNAGVVTLSYSPAYVNASTKFPFGLGGTTTTVTATDSSFNTATCVFTIVVIDTEPPTFTNCPSNSTYTHTYQTTTIHDLPYGVYSLPAISAVDNVAMDTTTVLGATSTYPANILAPITVTAKDTSGNANTCTYNILARDNQPPNVFNCPSTAVSCFNTPGRNYGSCLWSPLPASNDNVLVVTTFYTSEPPGTYY